MATSTPMLPGLGGTAVGPAPNLNSTTTPMSAQNVAAANATGSISTTPTMSSAGISGTPGAPLPTGALPTPQVNNNLAPGGHTTALPGGNTPATSPLATSNPMSVTQMLNTPITPSADLSKFSTQGFTATPEDVGAKYTDLHSQLKGTDAGSTKDRRRNSRSVASPNHRASDAC